MTSCEYKPEQARVILWGVPRCVSTSFLKCMTFVEDSVCWHEPYLYANMVGPDGTNTPYTADVYQSLKDRLSEREAITADAKPTYGDNIYEGSKHSFSWVKDRMEDEYRGKRVIFNKDMVQGIDGHYDALLVGFRHTFLIRHPLKVFASFKTMAVGFGDTRKLQEWTPYMIPVGYFFKEIYELVEYVKKELEPHPVIIDADDLLTNPAGIMKAYCNEVGIPFKSSLLCWPAGDEVMISRWYAQTELVEGAQLVHESTFASTGFTEPSTMPNRDDLPDDVVELADASLPYYEKLYEERLRC